MKIFLYEFIGTFILLLAILATQNTFFIAFAFLAAILIAGFSGSHINPVVTMVMKMKGTIPGSSVPEYILGQVAGGLAALYVSKHFL